MIENVNQNLTREARLLNKKASANFHLCANISLL